MAKKQEGARELMLSALFSDRQTVELPLTGYECQALIWALEAYAEEFRKPSAPPETEQERESDAKTITMCEELTERIYQLWSP